MASIRVLQFETDADTQAKCVLDIREFDAPAPQAPNASFTTLSKDLQRRELLVALSRQVDDLLAGRTDEVVIVLN